VITSTPPRCRPRSPETTHPAPAPGFSPIRHNVCSRSYFKLNFSRRLFVGGNQNPDHSRRRICKKLGQFPLAGFLASSATPPPRLQPMLCNPGPFFSARYSTSLNLASLPPPSIAPCGIGGTSIASTSKFCHYGHYSHNVRRSTRLSPVNPFAILNCRRGRLRLDRPITLGNPRMEAFPRETANGKHSFKAPPANWRRVSIRLFNRYLGIPFIPLTKARRL